jgi:hypothetical protein
MKVHSQFMPALAEVMKSLETYGHGPIMFMEEDGFF